MHQAVREMESSWELWTLMGTENALHMVGEVSSAEDAKQKDMKRNGR